MTASAEQVLTSFDDLPEAEQKQVASESLRRAAGLDLRRLSDEELVLNAEEVFLELDRREQAG